MVATVVTTGLIVCAGRAHAQGPSAPETKMYLSVDVGAQPTQREFEIASSFPLYDETATISSKQAVHNGPMFGVTVGYRIKPRIGIGIGLGMFNARESDSTTTASIPSPIFFDRPARFEHTETGLTHSEQVLHVQLSWFQPVGDKFEVVLSAGPSAFYVKQDLVASVTVQPGTQIVTANRDNQAHGAAGFNGGMEGNYFFNAQFGAGIFVRYTGATVDLPAVAGLKLGGVQAGLGLRARF